MCSMPLYTSSVISRIICTSKSSYAPEMPLNPRMGRGQTYNPSSLRMALFSEGYTPTLPSSCSQ